MCFAEIASESQPETPPAKFLLRNSESNRVLLSKNLSLEREIATNFDSRQKYAFGAKN